jgi:hypothetical protein
MTQVQKLRHVDPYKRRGRLYLALCRFSATKVGAWLSVHVAWKIDPYLLKLTRGRLSTTAPVAAALLESCGARTGKTRRNATLYFHDGDRVTIVASLRGWPRNPAWYYNLCRHPDVVFGVFPSVPKWLKTKLSGSACGISLTVFTRSTRTSEEAQNAGRGIPIVQLIPR